MSKNNPEQRAERRRAARFAADYRVVCRLGHDALTTSTRDLSLGGMRLAYTGHVEDIPAEFQIDLGDGEPPLRIRGHAVSDGPEGLRVEFERSELARKRIRRLIRGRVIPTLEQTVRQTQDPATVDELAACLREVGLVDDAIQLYRSFSPPAGATASAALSEIDQLRASIRRQRRTLYAGFQRLLKDRNQLRQLTGEGALDAAPQEHRRLTALLRGVQREVEILDGNSEPEVDLPAGARHGWARSLYEHRLGIALGLALLAGGVGLGRWTATATPSRAAKSPPTGAARAAVAHKAPPPALPAVEAPTPSLDIDALLDRLAAEHDEEQRRLRHRAQEATDAGTEQPAANATNAEAPALPPTQASDVEHTDADFARALRYLGDRKIGLAVVALQRVVARSPRDAEAWRLLGLSYVLIEQQGRARATLGRFLELAPEHPRAEQVRRVLASLPAL